MAEHAARDGDAHPPTPEREIDIAKFWVTRSGEALVARIVFHGPSRTATFAATSPTAPASLRRPKEASRSRFANCRSCRRRSPRPNAKPGRSRTWTGTAEVFIGETRLRTRPDPALNFRHWVCPVCDRSCRHLYYIGGQWQCRICGRLGYASRRCFRSLPGYHRARWLRRRLQLLSPTSRLACRNPPSMHDNLTLRSYAR